MNLKPFQEKIRQFTSRLSQKNKYESAIKEAEVESQSNPADTRLKLKMAETYFKAKNIEKAILSYREIAEGYLKDNFILKAIAVFKNVLKLDPDQVEINLKLAELYLKLEMISDAVAQYRIAIQYYESIIETEKGLAACKKLVEAEPSTANRRKLAESYQAARMTKEAIEQYEILAKTYRAGKSYDDLLRMYELILPHRGTNQALIRDICILYLRRQEPDKAIRTMELQKVDGETNFADLYDKAKLMQKALRTTKGKKSEP